MEAQCLFHNPPLRVIEESAEEVAPDLISKGI
jgi:hypothetical protein